MSLWFKGLVGLLLCSIAYNVLFDLIVVTQYPVTRQNTRGKRVLITGSSKGIGEALAQVFAAAGAHVVVHSRKAESLKKVSQRCLELGAASAHAVAGDMSKPDTAARVVNEAAAVMNGLDIVIVNHVLPSDFTTVHGAVTGLQDASTVRAMQINFFSYAQASAAALPHLEASGRQGGSLILVSSVASQLPIPYCYEYCSSKRALSGFFHSLRQELAINKSSVHVGMAALGLIDTDNARTAVRRHYSTELEYASRESTARDIASLTVARVADIVTPWKMRMPLLMRELLPVPIEQHLQRVVRKL